MVHGHFYQPPRENPWTESVPVEPSAAPFHDWNERITAECYRPNGWARIFDERGAVVGIVNNYEHLSFNVGPTLMSWLEVHAPDVHARMTDADAATQGGIAQAYNHMILPLANERDVRTQVRWGIADFEHRFGRRPDGMWLPETAVDDDVLCVLAEEGISFTILAPGQAKGDIDPRQAYRWAHPDPAQGHVDLIFYDGSISHDVAFGLGGSSSQALVGRVALANAAGGLVCIAADGETFGHHHTFAERALAYALPVEAPRAGVTVTNAAAYLRDNPPTDPVEVKVSSWSCVHGVERWRSDCGCSTGGPPGANQRWRAPLRAALDLLRDAGVEIFERRGGAVLHDPWAARDAYVHVILGAATVEAFADEHVVGGAADVDATIEALTLLEAQRHALLMYTSCAWFFWDLAGLETVQCLRYAARCLDLLRELGEPPPVEDFLEVLAKAESNQPTEGDGRAVWANHVDTARVDARRAVAHLALVDLIQQREPAGHVGSYEVVRVDHERDTRGGLTLSSGTLTLRHRRTLRRSRHAFAALHLGSLEILGAVRPAEPDSDPADLAALRGAFADGERITTLLRLLAEGFGPEEFGLDSALPDAAGQMLEGVATQLADRFVTAYDQLFTDNRGLLTSLATAGYPLPPVLRAPAELALTRRFEAEMEAQRGAWDPAAYRAAVATVREAEEGGVQIDSPDAVAVLGETLLQAVTRALTTEDHAAIQGALAIVSLARDMGLDLDLGRVQDLVYDRLLRTPDAPDLMVLGAALGLAVDHLGVPDP